MGFRFFRPVRSLRAGFAVLLLSAAVLFTSYRMAGQISLETLLSKPAPDPVSEWETNLTTIRADLPASGTVGYVADWDIPGSDFNQDDQDVEYILTQFALVPLLVQRGVDHPFVIGNLTDENLAKALETYHLSLLEKYGRGIFLLKTDK